VVDVFAKTAAVGARGVGGDCGYVGCSVGGVCDGGLRHGTGQGELNGCQAGK
jgi:hypothetical protein